MPPLVRRHRARGRLAIESLEPRHPLAGDVVGQPDVTGETPTLVVCPPPAPAAPFTTGLPEAAAERPWISLAAATETGSMVIWVRIATTAGVPVVQTLPVWGRLNAVDVVAAACSDGAASSLSPDAALAGVTGWVFGGAGTDPAAVWPQPLETFAADAQPDADGVRDYFLVLQSPSDSALGLATAVAVLAGAPGAEFERSPETGAGPAVADEAAPLFGLLASGGAAPASGILPADAAAAAWLRDARGSDAGSVALWVDTTGGKPVVVPLFVKFNPAADEDPLFAPAETRSRAAWFYPADGGAAVPWPAALGEGEGEGEEPVALTPVDEPAVAPPGDASVGPAATGMPPGDGFLVVHSDSNFEIFLATLLMPMLLGGLEADGFMADESEPQAFATLFGPRLAPPAAVTVTLEQDTGVAGDLITSDGRLAVSSAADTRVEYSTDGGRSWGAEFTAIEGPNRVAVRQVDPLEQPSPETAFEFTLDTRAATPRIALADGTRPGAGNPLRRHAELRVRGLEPESRAEYSVAGGPWVGSWQAVEGQNAVRVRQVDVAANASEASTEMRFRIDSRVEPLTVALARDTGWSGTDRVTSDATLVLDGREAGAAVRYSSDGGITWSGRFSPREGRNVLLVRQVDEAGNVSAVTRFTFTLDRVRPPAPLARAGRGRVTIPSHSESMRLEYSVGGGDWTTDVVTASGQRGQTRVRFVDRAGNASVPLAAFRNAIRPG